MLPPLFLDFNRAELPLKSFSSIISYRVPDEIWLGLQGFISVTLRALGQRGTGESKALMKRGAEGEERKSSFMNLRVKQQVVDSGNLLEFQEEDRNVHLQQRS